MPRTDDVRWRGAQSPGAEAMRSRAPEAPSVTLPKGGGAIRGIGEKFAANPATGTGALTVPIATSPGRSGIEPALSLSYDSGSGNGVFGFGWSLDLPSIVRKTDLGLPRYRDREESDVFLLSGAEDLVPVLGPDGGLLDDAEIDPRYVVRRYRPRVDGLHARIERWTRRSDGAVHWRSIGADDVVTTFGLDAESRIADPDDPTRVFTWLICETRDVAGNAARYRYAPEDGAGVDLARACERSRGPRDDPRRATNRYLKRIEYGNRRPLLDGDGRRPRFLADLPVEDAEFMFEVVLDYGDHDPDAPTPRPDRPWAFRGDPFSSYRAGFEVRTTRLCRRVLSFHHVPDGPGGAPGYDGLVRSTDLTYSDDEGAGYAFLRAIAQTGHRRVGDRYRSRSLPPLELEYSAPAGPGRVRDVDAAALAGLPVGVDAAAYQWVDLRGEGMPGVLTEQAGAWFYRRNLSPAVDGGLALAAAELVAAKPSPGLQEGRAQFMDLAGDGRPDLVVLDGPAPGLYEHDGERGWQAFRAFGSRLSRALDGGDVRLVDLDGDGRADVLTIEDGTFCWHRSLGEDGFGPALRVAQPADEERGSRLVFSDAGQSIHLADLSGDGLADLARVRNGEVSYWPNLGHGRFGARVTMDGLAPLDDPDHFDQRRVRLADVDGTGTADLIYLHRDGPRVHLNRSGNGWTPPRRLDAFPPVDGAVSVHVADLLGNGTACLVWSSPLPGDAERRMRYLPLAGDEKPHLLTRAVNNLGVETLVRYAPSTKFSLLDERAGAPWATRLPFPVHVVEQVQTLDRVSRNRFVTRYAYHDGCFDGREREFRGFGVVDQWDTEELGTLGGADPAANEHPASQLPPVRTRTWFHTGEPSSVARLPPGSLVAPALPAGLSAAEEREAARALKGSMLRQEVYALDGGPRTGHPYTVAERTYAVRVEQRRGVNRRAVFSSHAAESIDRHHERDPGDPRTEHAITLETDAFGNVLKSVAIAYGRRQPSPLPDAADRARQSTPLLTYTEHAVTAAIADPRAAPDDHRTPLPAETRVFELTSYEPAGAGGRYAAADFVEPDPASPGRLRAVFEEEVAYHETASGSRRRRLVEWTRVLYRADDLSSLLPLGELEPRALYGETYSLALTTALLDHVLRRDGVALLPDPHAVLEHEGGYVGGERLAAAGRFPAGDPDGQWWAPSGRVFLSPGADDTAAQELRFAREHFFLPRRLLDPFGAEGVIRYDAHDLLVAETRDALGNRVTAGERGADGEIDPAQPGHDYRVLQPAVVSDANGNRTRAAFDALGLVVATAVQGKRGEDAGDSLDGLEPDLTEAEVAAVMDAPLADPAAVLGHATTRLVYDVAAHQRTGQPAAVCALVRETHEPDLAAGARTAVQVALSYSDGFDRVIQRKLRAEAGPVEEGGPALEERWVGSGWTVFNNKGLAVREFEPFFSATHRFELGIEAGVSAVRFFDPLGRVVAILHPDHSYEKSVFDAWRHVTWDRNDTVLDDPRTDPDVAGHVAAYFAHLPPEPAWRTWHEQRAAGELGPQEAAAAAKAAAHARTPASAHVDVLGRSFLSVADNGADPGDPERRLLLATRTELDVEGNRRAVHDALGRTVMRHRHDLLGNELHRHGMDSGARWGIHDAAGWPLRAWDQRGNGFRTEYDALRRPVRRFLRMPGADGEALIECLVHGERHPEAAARNLRGVVWLQLDQAGAVETEAHDFKGNPLRTSRRLTSGTRYRDTVDWSAIDGDAFDPAALEPMLEPERYTASSVYDALDRPVALTSPHAPGMAPSVVRPAYNEANLLERLDVELRGAADATPFVAGVDYDALGRRRRIDYGNGVSTAYAYDPRTLRLVGMRSARPADGGLVQDLGCTYDPAGNVVHVRDDAQQRIFFANQVVEPTAAYTYDAIYRLVEATGREHLGQNAAPIPHSADDAQRLRLPHPGDGQAMGRYTERYAYDAAGNIVAMRHVNGRAGSGWSRRFDYAEDSSLEPGTPGNRLTATGPARGDAPPADRYRHDAHGNMVRMPHLRGEDPEENLHWDHFDRLRRVDPRGGGTAFCVYDADGERVRKVWERPGGVVEERIYLGDLEIYRRTDGSKVLERETLHVAHGGERIALVETRTGDTAGADRASAQLTRFQLANHLGSAVVELDERARIVSYEEYTPYGSTAYQAVGRQTETPKRYRHTGKERDEESGLGHHGARYYAPWLGRWTSCDPIGLADGVNVYCYVHDDPIGMVDRTGTEGTPILTPSGQPTPLTWIDPDDGSRTSRIPAASLSGPSTVTTKPAAKPAPPPPPPPPKPAPPPAAAPSEPEFEPAVSDPEALRRAEGMGHIEVGDVVQFGKGLVNGPGSLVGAPQFEIDEHYAGAAEVGSELGKNLVLEVATAGAGKALELAAPFLRRAVRAPAFMFVGAGGPGAAGRAARVAERTAATAVETGGAAASAVRPDIPTMAIIPLDRTATRAGKAVAPKLGTYRGVTKKMRAEAQRLGETYHGPGKYDVSHRDALSQLEPGAPARLKSEARGTNRADGNAIAKANAERRKVGLYTRK